jgi:hypothetical protein
LLVGAYVTWRQLQLSRESMRQTMEATNAQLKAAQDQLTVDRESQLTQARSRSCFALTSASTHPGPPAARSAIRRPRLSLITLNCEPLTFGRLCSC